MSLQLTPEQAAALHEHLRRAYPEEGCGVLLGHDTGADRRVGRVIGFDNERADSRHNRYVISPEQFLAAEKAARQEGLDVIGFFHSHPDHPARPSAFDLEHAWPFYSYVIVSVERGVVAATTSWRLAEDRSAFASETLAVEPARATAREGDSES